MSRAARPAGTSPCGSPAASSSSHSAPAADASDVELEAVFAGVAGAADVDGHRIRRPRRCSPRASCGSTSARRAAVAMALRSRRSLRRSPALPGPAPRSARCARSHPRPRRRSPRERSQERRGDGIPVPGVRDDHVALGAVAVDDHVVDDPAVGVEQQAVLRLIVGDRREPPGERVVEERPGVRARRRRTRPCARCRTGPRPCARRGARRGRTSSAPA